MKEDIKSGLALVGDVISEVAASVAEKNRLRVQLNHIKGLIKANTATRDQAYVELGRFFYEHMREDASPENEAICAVIDAANQRISSASIKYMELLNLQNETKIGAENTEKLKKMISDAAADAAKAAKEKGTEIASKAREAAKEKGTEFAAKAKEAAESLKDRAAGAVEEVKDRFIPMGEVDIDDEAETEAAEETVDEPAAETAEPEKEEAPAEESPESFDF